MVPPSILCSGPTDQHSEQVYGVIWKKAFVPTDSHYVSPASVCVSLIKQQTMRVVGDFGRDFSELMAPSSTTNYSSIFDSKAENLEATLLSLL